MVRKGLDPGTTAALGVAAADAHQKKASPLLTVVFKKFMPSQSVHSSIIRCIISNI